MKVTDEMVERALRVAFLQLGNTQYAAGQMRIALTAALADVPDPEDVRAEVMEGLAYGRSVERQALDARIAELEAKLAQVRQCVAEWRPGGNQASLVMPRIAAAILDGKEQP